MFSFLQNMWCAAYSESQHWYPAQHVRRYILCDSNILHSGVWRHQPRHLAKPGFHAVDDNCGFCYDSNTGMERKGPRIRDGWMICDFTSFSTVFQDDGQMIMKSCVQWNPFCS